MMTKISKYILAGALGAICLAGCGGDEYAEKIDNIYFKWKKDRKSLTTEEKETIKDFCENKRHLEIIERNKNDENIVGRAKEQYSLICVLTPSLDPTKMRFEYK